MALSNKQMQLTSGGLMARFARCFINAPLAADVGVVSSERRNISAMIRATRSGRPGWNVTGRATHGA